MKSEVNRVVESLLSEAVPTMQWLQSIVKSVRDNGGKTADRYTVFFKDSDYTQDGDYLGMSDRPTDPQGFSQWGDRGVDSNALGKRISFRQLPPKIQQHVLDRFKEVFDEQGAEAYANESALPVAEAGKAINNVIMDRFYELKNAVKDFEKVLGSKYFPDIDEPSLRALDSRLSSIFGSAADELARLGKVLQKEGKPRT